MRFVTGFLLLCATAVMTVWAGPAVADAAPGAAVSVTPASFTYGPIHIGGELGEPGEFTVTNTGTETVTLTEAGITGSQAGSFLLLPNASSCFFLELAGEIPAGESCTLVVIFDPRTEGANSAELEVISDAPSSPDRVALTGTGLPRLLPGATLTPRTVSFAGQPVGSGSEPETVTLTSSGGGDLDIGPVLVFGEDADQFRISRNQCSNRVMAAGDSCRIEVVFEPGDPGTRQASLTVVTNAEGAETTVGLSGTAISPPAEQWARVTFGSKLPRIGRSGKAMLPVRCRTSGLARCAGRLVITARGRSLGLRHDRPVRVARRNVSFTPGWHRLRLKLSRRARGRVLRTGRLEVRVSALIVQGDGTKTRLARTRTLRR